MSARRSVLPYGDRALLVEVEDTAAVMAWTAALAGADLAGVAEVVPAARTLLVVAAEGADPAALATALRDLEVRERGQSSGATEEIEIPVTYDGPDLADVAGHTGLSEREVVAAHTGQAWQVAFGGFAPGFGYLVGEDERLHVPRRDTARTRVRAGSVGLAGEFTGVYPRESPGGWQLIGSTETVLFDLDRDPAALLRPGVTVRFVEADP